MVGVLGDGVEVVACIVVRFRAWLVVLIGFRWLVRSWRTVAGLVLWDEYRPAGGLLVFGGVGVVSVGA